MSGRKPGIPRSAWRSCAPLWTKKPRLTISRLWPGVNCRCSNITRAILVFRLLGSCRTITARRCITSCSVRSRSDRPDSKRRSHAPRVFKKRLVHFRERGIVNDDTDHGFFVQREVADFVVINLHDAHKGVLARDHTNLRKSWIVCFYCFADIIRSEEHTSELQSQS